MGAEDLDQYTGPARLVRAAGDEDFDTGTHGEPAVEHPQPGQVIWRDDAGVTCRQRTGGQPPVARGIDPGYLAALLRAGLDRAADRP